MRQGLPGADGAQGLHRHHADCWKAAIWSLSSQVAQGHLW
jgi:hypothetical protein